MLCHDFKKTRYAISQLLKDLNMNYYTAVLPFWFVAVSVCRRSGLLLIAVFPFWFVAVLVSPFWRVAVLVCRRFDHRPLHAHARLAACT